MKKPTHTPGPWRIVTDGISHWIEIEPNKISLVTANQADRSLIAAAPDLLAALEASPQLDCHHDYHNGACWPCMARAAIAKAKGE